jgi:hypothetical protein
MVVRRRLNAQGLRTARYIIRLGPGQVFEETPTGAALCLLDREE